jgi:hypothetical protein
MNLKRTPFSIKKELATYFFLKRTGMGVDAAAVSTMNKSPIINLQINL